MRLQSVGNGLGGYTNNDSIINTSIAIDFRAPPFSVGMWFSVLTATTSPALFNMTNAGGETFQLLITGGVLTLQAADGVPTSYAINVGAVTQNAWQFVLARNIAANNHRLSVYDFGTGKTTHAADATAMSYSAKADQAVIGPPTGSSTGGALGAIDINDFWYVDADVQVDPGQTYDEVLQRLAWLGPFAENFPVGAAGKSVLPIEYRSFREHPYLVGRPRYTFFRQDKGFQPWTNGVTVGSVPISGANIQLPQYIRPGQTNQPVLYV